MGSSPVSSTKSTWSLPLGAQVVEDGVRFAVWAPRAPSVDVEILVPYTPPQFYSLTTEPDGLHAGTVAGLQPGTRYRFRLANDKSYPDPWSRSQPDGVHGASAVVDHASFSWTDSSWTGLDREALVIYELHVGTFSPSGTFDGIIHELSILRRLGVTAIELMPVGEFPGARSWGYDGVDLFAPSRNYGGVAALKRLVDAAHRVGLGVILDVVYNHFGPDGNYLRAFSGSYFTDRHQTPWGPALNFDGPDSARVREVVIQNACYWLVEYHLDGLRLDATHALIDESPRHILADLAEQTRAAVGGSRQILLIAEDDRRDISLARPTARGGLGLDGVWADDFHHAVHVLLTGERDGYYQAYSGTPNEIASAVRGGFVYQGQWSTFHGDYRGSPVLPEDPAAAFVFCIQNHDQVGNRAFGERLNHLVDPRQYAVAVALLLLCPEVPLLFMGQEFAASTPFLYFTDHEPALGQLVSSGRREEFARFASFRDPSTRERIPDPQDERTFFRSRLNLTERESNPGILRLHRDLLRLRRTDLVLSNPDRFKTETTALGDRCIAIRRWAKGHQRLLVANASRDGSTDVTSILDAQGSPPDGWRLVLSTGWHRYSGEASRRIRREPGRPVIINPATALLFAK